MGLHRLKRMIRAAFIVGLVLLPPVGALVWGSLACAATQFEDHGVVFEQHEVVTGRSPNQTVLTGFLLENSLAELAVVDLDENGSRRLRLYAFGDGAWTPTLESMLRPCVEFVDVAKIGGRDRLISYERGRVSWFDPESATENELVAITACYRATNSAAIPHVDITRDVNRDGLDDIVMPDFDGFWISTQTIDGSFTEAVKLGPPEPFLDMTGMEDQRRYGDVGITDTTVPAYMSRVHELDFNLDGRSDLVFWNEDHFDAYVQNDLGQFDLTAKPFSVDVHFDSDGVYSHAFAFSGESELSLFVGARATSKRTVLHSFRDMNGDGVADLITHSMEGRSIMKQRNMLAVHYGEPTRDGVQFAREADTTVQPSGSTVLGYQTLELRDFDGDGQIDIVHALVETGFGQMIRAMAGNSISMDLAFYRLDGGAYPAEPDATRKILPDVCLFDRRGPFFPTVLGGDVNGDGRADLIVGQSRQELRVFVGVPGQSVFSPYPQKVNVALTANENDARVVDLNGDSKQDLLVQHPSATGPNRVIMLIAR